MAWLSKLLHWEAPKTPQVEIPPQPPSPPVETPTEPIKPPTEAPRATLENFCLAIKEFEGYVLPGEIGRDGKTYPVGSASYRNKNPGNVKYNPGGYMPMYGIVQKSIGGFAIFPTYDLGWLYLKNMLKGMFHKRPELTIYEFMLRYAPPEDNNPTMKYAAFIGKKLGVDPMTYKVKNLT